MLPEFPTTLHSNPSLGFSKIQAAIGLQLIYKRIRLPGSPVSPHHELMIAFKINPLEIGIDDENKQLQRVDHPILG
jgi:hypothetical protein